MNERLQVLSLAAAALALFYLFFFPKAQPAAAQIVLPLSTESRPAGYQALWIWLERERIPAVSLRYRFDRLESLLRAPTGNVLIMTMPQRVPPRTRETEYLARWVEKGNTLVVMAALADTPLWMLGADPLFEDHLERYTGLRFDHPSDLRRGAVKSLTKTSFDMELLGPHPLTAGVRRLVALSALPARRGALRAGLESVPLELAMRSDTADTTLLLTRRGAGQAIVSTTASPFSNGAVALADNAQLLADILAWSRSSGGSVIFDDAHQGLTAYYDGAAFFADPRLHHTLIWILVLWLLFVLGALPLRNARSVWQPLNETAYVEAGARYFAAVVPPSAAAQHLIERFLREIARTDNQDRNRSGFEVLDRHAGVSHHERSTLRELYTRACAGRPVALVRVQNLLSQLRRIIQ